MTDEAASPWWRPDRVLVVVALANTGLLMTARFHGAGAFGVEGVPFLLAELLVCGALFARAVLSALRSAPRPLALVTALAAAAVGLIGSSLSWASTASSDPLLPPLLAWAALPAIVWAVVAPRQERAAAVVAGVALAGLWVMGAVLDT